jgi:YHS domain-containing protein
MRRIVSVVALAFALAACAAAGGGAASRTGGVKPYPLDRCLVTDTKLGSMGDPFVMVYRGQELKFCCEPCVDEFERDPEKFLKLLSR